LLIGLIEGAWTHGGSTSAFGPNLRQQNVFGITGSAWATPSTYYTPGKGNPAISTADYYHMDGLYWFRPNDLTNAACGSTGASIAASRGRYVWFASPDHPDYNYGWADGRDFMVGYSSDPGIFPASMTSIIRGGPNFSLASVPVATITASISGTTLSVTAITGTMSFDNNAVVAGTGVTANTFVLSQISGTPGGIGTYSLSNSMSVGSESMTVSQQGYFLYQAPWLVCNPDDASFPFYLYAEGSGSRVQHEEGYAKSADLINWTVVGPSHITMTYGGTLNWSSFQRVVRDSAGSWHSTGLQSNFPAGSVFGSAKWTSTDGKMWVPNPTTLINVCLPPNSTGPAGALPCPDSPAKAANLDGAPDTVTAASQAWMIGGLSNYISGTRVGNQWLARTPIDVNFNVLASPSPVLVSTPYGGVYPSPSFLQNQSGYVEDGVAHYYASNGFFPSSANDGLVNGATYANGGGLWQQAIDYYTEILDPVAAANAAPVGVAASCSSSVVYLNWYNALPNNTYRVYRGTTAGSQTTLVANVTGTTISDSGAPAGAVAYYKIVTMNAGVEQKSRVVSTYVSSSSAFVNAHITRVLAAGGDVTTINRAWLDTVYNWLTSNNLLKNLLIGTMVENGVAKSGSTISTIYDLGTTRLPRIGDYTTTTANTTYNATGIGGAPAWVNGGSSNAWGYYGNGRLNNLRRMTQLTMYALYQKGDTLQASLFGSGGDGTQGISLYHSAGTPGAANFLLADATQTKTATATISGSATAIHSIAGTFDGTTLLAYADAAAGTGLTGLVIPSPDLTSTDALTGQTSNPLNVSFLGSGAQVTKYTYGTGYIFEQTQANFNGGALFMFDVALTSAQISSLDTLLKGHF
jgi:hypothetical protein